MPKMKNVAKNEIVLHDPYFNALCPPSPLIWAMRRRAGFLWEDFPYEKGHLAG